MGKRKSHRREPKVMPLRISQPLDIGATWHDRMRARAEAEIVDAASKRARFERPAALANYARVNPHEPETMARYEALPAEHPLVRARIKLDAELFNAGNTYRVLYEKAHDTRGHDSTQIEHIDRGRNTDGAGLSAAERDTAKKALARIDGKLGLVNSIIVRNFCGAGVPAATAVRAATVCRSSTSTWDRLTEALTALRDALRGQQRTSAPIRGGEAEPVKAPSSARGWRASHRSFGVM